MTGISDQDQASLWQQYLKDITKSMDGVEPENVMVIPNKVSCVLDDSNQLSVNAQMYNIANSIPPEWNMHWNGGFSQNLFDIYRAWVLDLSGTGQPKPGTEDEQNKLEGLEKKLQTYDSGLASINATIYDQYVNDWCLCPKKLDSGHFTCDTENGGWIPDGKPTFSAYRQEKLKDADVQRRLALLSQDLEEDLDAIQQQIMKLRNTIYGSDAKLETLTEAQMAVRYADPLQYNKNDSLQNQYQMKIMENDAEVWQPRCIGGEGNSFNTYYNWVQAQKAVKGQPLMGADSGANVVSIIEDSKTSDKGESWKFSANLGFPIDWFWLGGSASGSHKHEEKSDYEFKVTVTYQDVTYVPLRPGDWFKPGLIPLFKDFSDWPDDSPFKGKQLWGAQGMMNATITGIIVGYAPYMRLEFTDTTKVDDVTTWAAGVSYGIGPFSLESGSASGSTWDHETTMNGNVVELKDTSGVPKIIAVVLEANPA